MNTLMAKSKKSAMHEPNLEQEADVIGQKANQLKTKNGSGVVTVLRKEVSPTDGLVQMKPKAKKVATKLKSKKSSVES